jgi:hypothetical protein
MPSWEGPCRGARKSSVRFDSYVMPCRISTATTKPHQPSTAYHFSFVLPFPTRPHRSCSATLAYISSTPFYPPLSSVHHPLSIPAMTATQIFTVFAGILALIGAYFYFIGIDPETKRELERKALKTMGENKMSYMAKGTITYDVVLLQTNTFQTKSTSFRPPIRRT